MGQQEHRVLMVYAHPDDETFGAGGTTAALSERGVAVHILLATRGQAGSIADPELDTPANRAHLGPLREAEARAAAATLGAAGIAFLDHLDGALDTVDRAQLVREVAAEVRRVRPDVVVTFGPEGVYGHPDHVAVHHATAGAFSLAAEPAVAVDGLGPHAAGRLFYQVIRAELAATINEWRGPVVLDGREHPFVGYADDVITTRVDISAVVERKLAALACHRTQTAGRMDEIRERLLQPPHVEHFILAASRLPAAEGLAHDLLAGLEGRDSGA